ncbi:uncharacterized protein EDB93DRAFT_1184571 [Suillus bovinus]|uniref:uncharacterized protein n=1 Tax=Suillus bovinus TaxID=48563 RepID=UPI001B86AC9E|nr:uncharacterized protein EDB93DRAFT_1184571 [Suillus bovinus]KAG2128361.1 hypothetical protein EDB93DRAFT_1184571 [Suillus bovinus]
MLFFASVLLVFVVMTKKSHILVQRIYLIRTNRSNHCGNEILTRVSIRCGVEFESESTRELAFNVQLWPIAESTRRVINHPLETRNGEPVLGQVHCSACFTNS